MLSLRLFNTYKTTRRFVTDWTGQASGTWRRSVRAQGGYWQGEFTMTGNLQDLLTPFYEYLGFHFEERSGGAKTWEGMIYELELTHQGVVRRRTLEHLANYVWAKYRDTSGTRATTSVTSDTASISKFGRREELLYIDGFDQTSAEAYRKTYMTENAWPVAQTIGVGLQGGSTQLRVTVCGYAFTGNWRFESVGDGTTVNLSDYLKSLITTDCEFLQMGSIATNTMQVRADTSIDRRVWDTMTELTGVGDASGNPYRLYVDNDRYTNYEPISTAVRYFIRDGKIFTGPGENVSKVDPWAIKPAVFRDMNYAVRGKETGSWLADKRDFYISEVEVSPAGIVLKTQDFEESEILAAHQSYLAQLGSGAIEEPGGEGGEGEERMDSDWWKNHPGLLREKSKKQVEKLTGGKK